MVDYLLLNCGARRAALRPYFFSSGTWFSLILLAFLRVQQKFNHFLNPPFYSFQLYLIPVIFTKIKPSGTAVIQSFLTSSLWRSSIAVSSLTFNLQKSVLKLQALLLLVISTNDKRQKHSQYLKKRSVDYIFHSYLTTVSPAERTIYHRQQPLWLIIFHLYANIHDHLLFS